MRLEGGYNSKGSAERSSSRHFGRCSPSTQTRLTSSCFAFDSMSSRAASPSHSRLIFPPFHCGTAWRTVDDRIRGGSSISHLELYQPHRAGEDTPESSVSDVEGETWVKVQSASSKSATNNDGAVRFWGTLGESLVLRCYPVPDVLLPALQTPRHWAVPALLLRHGGRLRRRPDPITRIDSTSRLRATKDFGSLTCPSLRVLSPN